MKYRIKLTNLAKSDIEQVIDYIETELFAPITAENFFRGLYAEIRSLKKYAEIYTISSYKDILIYGKTARRINYKDFVIIYTVHNDLVIVHRIIHGTLIKK